jgi:hypothetical protein
MFPTLCRSVRPPAPQSASFTGLVWVQTVGTFQERRPVWASRVAALVLTEGDLAVDQRRLHLQEFGGSHVFLAPQLVDRARISARRFLHHKSASVWQALHDCALNNAFPIAAVPFCARVRYTAASSVLLPIWLGFFGSVRGTTTRPCFSAIQRVNSMGGRGKTRICSGDAMLISIDELRRLPHNMVVALAARSARRVLPLFQDGWYPDPPPLRHVLFVVHAIQVAEENQRADAEGIAGQASLQAEAVPDRDSTRQFAAQNAAKAATEAARTAGKKDAARAAVFAERAIIAAERAAYPNFTDAIRAAIRADYEQAVNASAAAPTDLDQPNLSRAVFGPLWRAGQPSDWLQHEAPLRVREQFGDLFCWGSLLVLGAGDAITDVLTMEVALHPLGEPTGEPDRLAVRRTRPRRPATFHDTLLGDPARQ